MIGLAFLASAGALLGGTVALLLLWRVTEELAGIREWLEGGDDEGEDDPDGDGEPLPDGEVSGVRRAAHAPVVPLERKAAGGEQ